MITEILTFLKSTLKDTLHIITSRERLKQVWQSPFYRNTFFLMTGTLGNAVLGFVFWAIAAKLYTAEVVGFGSAVTSAFRFLALFAELGLGISLVRYLPEAGKTSNKMINTCFTLSGFAAAISSLIFVFGLEFWSPALLIVREQPIYFIAFVIFTISLVLQPHALYIFIARLQTRYTFIIQLTAGILGIILLIAFALLSDDALGLFSAMGLPITITFVLCLFWFIPKIQNGYRPIPAIDSVLLKKVARYSGGNFLGKGILMMTQFIMPLIVVNTLGTEMNAYFYMPWSIGIVLQHIPAAISNSLFAEVSNDELTLKKNTLKSLKLILLLLTPAVLIVTASAGILLLIFGHEYSANGAQLLRLIAISIIPWGINQIYIGVARVKNDFKGIIIIPAITTCLSLGLSYIFMSQMGLVGIGFGYLLGQGVVALPVLFLLWRTHKT